jgi:hypothetical protein
MLAPAAAGYRAFALRKRCEAAAARRKLRFGANMAQDRSVPCPKCGALNDVLVPDDSFEEQMRYASFVFACRICGTELPRPAAEPEGSPEKT